MEGNGNIIEQYRPRRGSWNLLDNFTVETNEFQGAEQPPRAICKRCGQNFAPVVDRYDMIELKNHSIECKQVMKRIEVEEEANRHKSMTVQDVQYDVQYDEEGNKKEALIFIYGESSIRENRPRASR